MLSTSGAPATLEASARPSSRVDRVLAILPWIGLGLGILIFYWALASIRKTPWLFTDELEWSQLSRAIAETGHAERRGEPIGFKSLYTFLIAPAWWIDSTSVAYAAIKALNVVVMCLAAVPTYLLSRMFVRRRVAIVVALLAIAIPAMSYTSAIVPESLAYLWFCVAAWLGVRALAAPTRANVVLALVPAALGPLVRKQFVGLVVSLLLAAAVLWVVRDPGTGRLRHRWQRVAVAVGVVGVAGLTFNWLVIEQIQSWTFSQYWNRGSFEEGAVAAGALAVGLGLLPVIGGIASLWLPERRHDPAYRAFAAYLGASIVTMWVYTAGKATYLASVFTPLIEERNLFYLSPLLLLGTAMVLGARTVDMRLVAAATALVLVTLWSGRLVIGAPYFEAPGLAMVTILNRNLRWDISDLHLFFIGVAIVAVALILARRWRGVPLVAAILVGGWLVIGQTYAADANRDLADRFAKTLPAPRDWVDDATDGRPVTYLGRQISDGNLLWLTEFWNRSVAHVASLDGSAPGPGPASVVGLTSTDGTLGGTTGDLYVLADHGILLQAPLVEERNGMRLYSTPGPWRLRDETQGVYGDGWAGEQSQYALLGDGGPGDLVVDLSRTAYTGTAPPGRATVEFGTVRLDQNGIPQLDRVLGMRRALVENGKEVSVRMPVRSTPVAVRVRIAPTFNEGSDPRELGAQVAFRFEPRSGA